MDGRNKRTEGLAWVGVFLAAAMAAVGTMIALASRTLTMPPIILTGAMLGTVSLLVAIRFRLARRQEIEAYDLQLYRDEHPGSELFDDSDEALKMAARASRSYCKYAIPVLTVLVGAVFLVAGILLWRHWAGLPAAARIQEPARYAILAAFLLVVCLLVGSYYVGVSREPGARWLRPCGAWIFFAGFVWALAAISLFAQAANPRLVNLDRLAGYLGLGAFLALAAELVINVVIDFYRPRGLALEADKPVLESRLLALLTEPGGIARNMAASLDYQFGFRISEAGFYRFLEKSLLPLGLLLAAAMWLTTCIVVIDKQEQGIHERFGRVVDQQPLPPGLYAKLPWPLARLYTYPVKRVQQLAIGYKTGHGEGEQQPPTDGAPEEMGDLTGRVIVWDKSHNLEEFSFVVASQPDAAEDPGVGTATLDSGKVPVSTTFMAASMPLFFKVDNLYDYAYRHRAANDTLVRLATRELAAYCAKIDFFELLTRRRSEAADQLRLSIQAAADELQLGVEIVFVGLHGVHPPVKVGKAFNQVVSASEEMHTIVLQAEKQAVSAVTRAEGEAVSIRARADSYQYDRIQVARAEGERFHQQLQAFEASPALFPLRSYLDVLEVEGRDIRKYVVAKKSAREVIILNLEEKLRKDLLDIDLDRRD